MTRSYRLLTGATGLLGGYLLRDALAAGLPLAVVARRRSKASARDRIEAAVASWEQLAGRFLPRPVVLEGDLLKPGLGLGDDELSWVARHCDSVIHSAASVRFEASSSEGEPYRSNVGGTRNLLDLCRHVGIRRFHHVSTAYIARPERGVAVEGECGESVVLANDYERSKYQAEALVRGALFLEPPTILRPSIIVGDFVSGSTTTFHGIYTPLRLGSLYLLGKFREGVSLDREVVETVVDESFFRRLGLSGDEGKNLVPVDWVSALILYLVTHPEHHGSTYHLTNPRPVTVDSIRRSMIEAVWSRLDQVTGGGHSTGALPPALVDPESLASHMDVYRAYFSGDPEFEAANVARVAPHLPCPVLDDEALGRLWGFALDAGFSASRSARPAGEIDLAARMARLERSGEEGDFPKLQLEVSGPGGGAWRIAYGEDRPRRAWRGVGADCEATVYMSSWVIAALSSGRLEISRALDDGLMVIDGEPGVTRRAADAVSSLASWVGGFGDTSESPEAVGGTGAAEG